MAGELLHNGLVYLGTALVCVPIAKRLGVGSVLGYIIGGIIIGPFFLGLIGKEGEAVMHIAEFGVVMMLFAIGLEMNPSFFWKMRHKVFGMGLLQLLVTTLCLLPIFMWLFHLEWKASIALSLSLAMSSTAIVLQTLKEKGIDKTEAGEASFSILLFQDIAVIPLLALIPLLGGTTDNTPTKTIALPSLLQYLDAVPGLLLLLAIGFVYIISRFLVSIVLHFIAQLQARELFTVFALFLVIAISTIMQLAGISAALGAFMAGVLLANSEFRHELESDIAPFKGLLLGIFFIAVGSTINFLVILENTGVFVQTLVLVLVIKAIVLIGIGKIFSLQLSQQVVLGILLSQVGEFAFVLLGTIQSFNLLPKTTYDLFMAVITFSMIATPVILYLYQRFLEIYLNPKFEDTTSSLPEIEQKSNVILIGFGHFGSTLGRFLRANKVNTTIIDNDSDRVSLLRKMGFDVYYGDGTRLDLLEAAGAAEACIIISAIDGPDENLTLSELVAKHYPNAKFFVRAKNRFDAYELMEKEVTHIQRESLNDSVLMGVEILSSMGYRRYTSYRKAQDFIKYDREALAKLALLRKDNDSYIASAKEEIALQERLLQEDSKFMQTQKDHAWDASLREN